MIYSPIFLLTHLLINAIIRKAFIKSLYSCRMRGKKDKFYQSMFAEMIESTDAQIKGGAVHGYPRGNF